jgi:hypothetical protein
MWKKYGKSLQIVVKMYTRERIKKVLRREHVIIIKPEKK